jgi:hypothetical protein
MRVLSSIIAAGVLAAGAAPAFAATTYVAYDEFKVVGGAVQTGVFAGGTTSGPFTGVITPFAQSSVDCGAGETFCVRTGEASLAKAYDGDYDPPNSVFFKDGFINMHASATLDSVLQFIAPTAGAYNFAGNFTAHDSSPTGVSIAGYIGTSQQFATTFLGGSSPFNFNATLAAGDKVNFVLGAAGDYTYDSTGLKLTVTGRDATGAVPEPATWAMMILGFFGMGATLRQRRRLTA